MSKRKRSVAVKHRFGLGVKRAFDLVASGAVACLVGPFLPFVALVVRREFGSVFFVQERVGLHRKPFKIYKFKTMKDAPRDQDHTRWTDADEARLTPLSEILRDFGIDELPQLINIFNGDMSIIGPRPPLPESEKKYTEEQRQMFQMRPGVLSLAVIKGRRSLEMADRIRYHREYVRSWSLGLDLEILWKCLFVVMKMEGVKDRQENYA